MVGPADARARAWLAEAMLRKADGRRPAALSALRAGLRIVEDHQATLGAVELRAHVSAHRGALARFGAAHAHRERRPLACAAVGRARKSKCAVPQASRTTSGPRACSRTGRPPIDDERAGRGPAGWRRRRTVGPSSGRAGAPDPRPEPKPRGGEPCSWTRGRESRRTSWLRASGTRHWSSSSSSTAVFMRSAWRPGKFASTPSAKSAASARCWRGSRSPCGGWRCRGPGRQVWRPLPQCCNVQRQRSTICFCARWLPSSGTGHWFSYRLARSSRSRGRSYPGAWGDP